MLYNVSMIVSEFQNQHLVLFSTKKQICPSIIEGCGYLAGTGNVNFDLILPVMHCTSGTR